MRGQWWWLVLAVSAAVAGPERSYEVYQPTVERFFVNDTHAQELKYNHDSAVAWFVDRWFCLWNANEPPVEGEPNQLNYQSTSRDGRTWTPPVPCFESAEWSENPIPCPTGTQWQPNLIVVDGELWAVWTQNSRNDAYHGTYLSRLTAPDGKWRNELIRFEDGSPHPRIDGKQFRIFATQNPFQLRSGRVLAPVTISHEASPAADAPEGVTGWWAREKRNSVLYTDDGGRTWRCSPGAIQPGRSWAQWEPTVWEVAAGRVLMLSRNNDFRASRAGGPKPAEMLLWSESRDRGESWTPHEPVPLETVASRMHVLPLAGDRYVMVHNDWPADAFVSDRLNLALFFTRGAGVDFVAGPSVTDRESVVAYPQMWVHDGQMLISYSQGRAYRSIKVARVAPLPDPGRHYLFCRGNLKPSRRPELRDGAAWFAGEQQIAGRQPVTVGPQGFTVAAWIRPNAGGTVLDTRGSGPSQGFAFGSWDRTPYVFIHSADHNIKPASSLLLDRWQYLAVEVDLEQMEARWRVGDQRETVKLTGPPQATLDGLTAHIGRKRFEASGVAGFEGGIGGVAVYPTPRLANGEHEWLAAWLSSRPTPLGAARPPAVEPTFQFNAVDEAAVLANFDLPDGAESGWTVTDDGARLNLRGDASAGIDLDDNERSAGDQVELTIQFRRIAGERVCVATVGDANQPARLVFDGPALRLVAGTVSRALPVADPTAWQTAQLTTSGAVTRLTYQDQTVEVSHQPFATWAYLGDGFPSGQVAPDSVLELDVTALRSRVSRAAE